VFINESDVTMWKVIYSGENNTPFSGYHWLLYITFPEEYPQCSINIRFLTPIYHCNVNNDGKICLDILNTQWTSETRVREIFTKIAELIKNPNPLNAIDSVKGTLYQDNRQAYTQELQSHIKKSTQNNRNFIVKTYKLSG